MAEGEQAGPWVGELVDLDLGVVMSWDVASLVQRAICLTCDTTLAEVTLEGLRAGHQMPSDYTHSCTASHKAAWPADNLAELGYENLNQAGENNE